MFVRLLTVDAKKKQEGVPWGTFITGEAWRRALLLLPPPEVDFFFFLPFFHGPLSLFRGPRHTWVSQESHARTRKRGEEKEERKKLILPHFIIRNNILQNHNVYRAIRIYDCGKCAYSNAILVRFDRIIVRVKVIGEREAEARDCCREKLPHLSFQLY